MERNEPALILTQDHHDVHALTLTLPADSLTGPLEVIATVPTLPPSVSSRFAFPQSSPAPPLPPCSHTSTPSPSSPSNPPLPVTFNIAYPLLPSLEPRELPYFHKGAQIALDNILQDCLGNPDMSLLAVIADLEDKRPQVGIVRDDWERRWVVDGARWVGNAVEGWWVECFEDEGEDHDEQDEVDKGQTVDDAFSKTLAGEGIGQVDCMGVEEHSCFSSIRGKSRDASGNDGLKIDGAVCHAGQGPDGEAAEMLGKAADTDIGGEDDATHTEGLEDTNAGVGEFDSQGLEIGAEAMERKGVAPTKKCVS